MKLFIFLLIFSFLSISCGKKNESKIEKNSHVSQKETKIKNSNKEKVNKTELNNNNQEKDWEEVDTRDKIIEIDKNILKKDLAKEENEQNDENSGIALENTEYNPPFFDLIKLDEYKRKNIYHSFDNDTTISYKDKNKREIKIPLFSEYWNNRLYTKNMPELKNKIDEGLKKLNFKFLYNNKEGSLATIKDKNNIYYIKISYRNDGEARFFTYQERILEENKKVNINFTKDKKMITFNAKFDGEHYYYLKVDIIEGKRIDMRFFSDFSNKSYKIRNDKKKWFEKKYYTKYQILNISQYNVNNEITFKAYDGNEKIIIELVKTPYKIDKISKFNGKLGAIRIKNVSSSKVTVKPVGYITKGFNPIEDKLPNGDSLFWLAAGNYSLSIKNLKSAKKDKGLEMQTHLVPVESNKITVVDWPLYLDNMFKESTSNNIKSSNVRLGVFDIEKSKDIVTLNLALSNLPKKINITKENFDINENGVLKGKVLSIKRLKTPMNVVILLDSSGSMKRSMKVAIKAVESFINKLPKNAKITLVDFDTKVKPLKAKNRKDLIRKLNKIRANGATALYDSVIKGIELLKDKDRASIILFTDGKDANYNDTKRGSKADFDEMFKLVQKHKIPVYPIAFGKGADKTTLNSIAKVTATKYYEGDDKESLENIFTDISSDLGNAYKLKYQRMKSAVNSNTPVINFMIDRSGSMDTDPSWCDGCSRRIETVKNVLSDFISFIPNNFLIQFNVFNTEVNMLQIMTNSKAKVLYSIGEMSTGGGTDIVKACETGVSISNIIPSNNRYFIFLTDGAASAFKFDEEQMKRLKSALLAFKEKGIKTFWIGMVESKDGEEMLKKIASLSGGEYVINSDINEIKKMFSKIKNDISTIKDNKNEKITSLQIKFRKKNEKNGDILTAISEASIDFEPLKDENDKKEVKAMSYKVSNFDINKMSYNNLNANDIYGDDMPLKDVRLDKIIPIKDNDGKVISGTNKAVKLNIESAIIFNRLKGLRAGHRNRFMVLKLSLENLLKSQKVAVLDNGEKHPSSWINKSNSDYKYMNAIPTYSVPDLRSHLFIRINNSYEMPFDIITWALEKPLVEVDEYKVLVRPKIKKDGVLAFKIPDKPIKNLSLHFYDSAYGHIDIPIIGILKTKKEDIKKLPTESFKKLSDNFAIKIESEYFKKEIKGVKAKKNAIFDILEFRLQSNVNALLKFSAKQRFFMKINTKSGDFIIKAHAISKYLPMGLYDKIALAPGSNNKFRIAFNIPEALKNNKKSLFIELKGKDLELPLLSKITPVKEDESPVLVSAKEDGIKLKINNIYKLKYKRFAVDITFVDKKDGNSTRMSDAIVVSKFRTINSYAKIVDNKKEIKANKKGLGNFSNQSELKGAYKWIAPDNKTNNKILGYNNKSVILDGTSNRFIVIFNENDMEENKPHYLISPIFKDLSFKIDIKNIKKLPKNLETFLTEKTYFEDNSNYEKELNKLISKARARRIKAGKVKALKLKAMNLESSDVMAQILAPLPISVYGANKFSKIDTLEKLITELSGLEWKPSLINAAVYSKESVFTQNYLGEYEMQQIVYDYLKSMNKEIETGTYDLTEEGNTEIKKLANGYEVKFKTVPYIKWDDKSLVFPFLKPINELNNLIKKDSKDESSGFSKKYAYITMTLEYTKKRDNVNAQMGAMGSALGGNTKSSIKSDKIFNESFQMKYISDMPIDIWFRKEKNKDGKDILKSYYMGENGITYDNYISNANEVMPKKLIIKLETAFRRADTYTYDFKDNKKLENLFFTIAFASPDLPEASLKFLDKRKKEVFKGVKKITELSLLQWLNRDKIYKFIGLQTRYEKELNKKLKVKTSRMGNPRIIIAKIERSGGNIISSIDLRDVSPSVYGDELNIKSFNIMSGFMATEGEAAVIEGKTVSSIWKDIKNLKLILIEPSNKEMYIAYMKEKKIPENIISRLKNSNKLWLFPSESLNSRYGWYEVDPKTYKMHSVLDTGEYGSMSEYSITEERVTDGVGYFLGLLAGVQVSVTSVATASVIYSDFKDIIANAEKMANYAACIFGAIDNIVSIGKGSFDFGASPSIVAGCAFNQGIVSKGLGVAGRVVSLDLKTSKFNKNNISKILGGGFAGGFADGVALYFSYAKK